MIALLLASVLQSAMPATLPEPRVHLVGHTIRYEGEISREGAGEFLAALASAPDVTVVVVNSVGGDIESGMAMAEAIFARELDVHVAGRCISSCANYIFPAGRRKVIEDDALVIWHGSAIQQGLWKADVSSITNAEGRPLGWLDRWRLKRAVRNYGRRMQARQQALYEKLGVDAQVTVHGQRIAGGCSNWTFSVQDMARFGIRQVQAAPDYGRRSIRLSGIDWCLLSHPESADGTNVEQGS